MKSMNLDIDWGSEPGSRCSATTTPLPFDLSADLAVIYQGQNESGLATFSYRVEVFDMTDQYGQGVPVWTKYSKPKYLTNVRAQLEATVALLEWFGKNVLAFDPNEPDGVSCRGYNVGRSEPASPRWNNEGTGYGIVESSPPPAALPPVSDGGPCEFHNCYADAQGELDGRRFCGNHMTSMIGYVSLADHYGRDSGILLIDECNLGD